MTLYARIQDGIVAEIIEPMMNSEGNEIPIADRFVPFFVASLIDVTNIVPLPQPNWTASEENGAWTFAAAPQ
ncbi:hypothetical protein [Paraburkholderia gardini]|uniref:hypothetical protein n=1 Tax=Paraburkholderia gardini TaxID=2823469 RepID=UPI001DF172BF|nr:hypothetical protein [Paraburkholderia gardini]CAG4889268.1 hypothetical protein R69919_00699 [Paraburkholderia gardini]